MGFLYPAFLIGALAVALPIVLHLLRRDVAPEIPFTAVRLLRRSPVDRPRRRRLRDRLLLAARVLALLLLAAAFARPYVLWARGSPHALIIAIDRSFSMAADGAFERARTLARDAIDSAGSGERIAVIAFDAGAEIVAGPGSAADARAAIADLAPGFGATRYAAAFEKAAQIATQTPGRLILISDLQRSGLEGAAAALPPAMTFEVRDVGGRTANLAVDDVRVEGPQAMALIRNYGRSPRRGTARLAIDGREAASMTFEVAGRGAVPIPFAVELPESGALAVSLDDPDGYPADNARYIVIGPSDRPRVLIVAGAPASPAGFYLARALDAAGETGPDFDERTVTGAALSAMQPGQLGQVSVVALLSTRGVDRRAGDALAALLNRGGGVLIAAGPDVDADVLSVVLGWTPPLSVREQADPGVLATTDVRHPIFRPFRAVSANLGQVSFTRAWAIGGRGEWHALAEYTDGLAALLERRAGAGRLVLFTSDLDRRWNDFPLHPAFVPFVHGIVRHLSPAGSSRTSVLVSDVPPDVPPRPGVATLSGGRRAAINVDPRESAIDRVEAADIAASIVRAAPREAVLAESATAQVETRQGYWRYGLMLMLAALVAESFVGRT